MDLCVCLCPGFRRCFYSCYCRRRSATAKVSAQGGGISWGATGRRPPPPLLPLLLLHEVDPQAGLCCRAFVCFGKCRHPAGADLGRMPSLRRTDGVLAKERAMGKCVQLCVFLRGCVLEHACVCLCACVFAPGPPFPPFSLCLFPHLTPTPFLSPLF